MQKLSAKSSSIVSTGSRDSLREIETQLGNKYVFSSDQMCLSSDRRLNFLEIFNYLARLSGSQRTLIITTIENSLKFTFDVRTHVLGKPSINKVF